MLVGLDQSLVSFELEPDWTLLDPVAPWEGVFFVGLGEVEFVDHAVEGAGHEFCGFLLAELEMLDLPIETLFELASLFHFSEIHELNFIVVAGCHDVLGTVYWHEFGSGFWNKLIKYFWKSGWGYCFWGRRGLLDRQSLLLLERLTIWFAWLMRFSFRDGFWEPGWI